jgi:TrmH family RNA methyltransferase
MVARDCGPGARALAYNDRTVESITSRQNPLVREFRALARPGRHGQRILLDGEHLIREALEGGIRIETVAALDDALAEPLIAGLRAQGGRLVTVTAPVLDAMSPVRQPSGAVAIAHHGPVTLELALQHAPQLVAVLFDVQDPGNVGAIVRAAEACGATGLVATPGTADPFGWKALRGSMGSALRLPIARGITLTDALAVARARGLRVLATVPRDGTPLPSCELTAPSVILFGGEGLGLAREVITGADDRITIPMNPRVESMNVATAAAIVLYEAWRQRAFA